MRHLLFFVFAFGFSIVLNAQVKSGFKLLKARQYDEATIAFEQQIKHPKHGIGAYYGLSLVHEAQKDSYNALLLSLDYAAKADSLLRKTGQKKYSVSNHTFTLYTYPNQTSKHARSIWNLIKKNRGTFIDAEHLRRHASDFFYKNRNNEQVAPHLKKLIEDAIENINDYDILNSIVQNYPYFMEKKFMGNSKDLGDKLLESFIKDKGLHKIRDFFRDHPKHWVARDCWKEQLIEVCERRHLDETIEFLRLYPDSYLGWFLIFIDLHKYFPPSSEEVKGLSEKDKKYYQLKSRYDKLLTACYIGIPKLSEITTVAEELGNGWHTYVLLKNYIEACISKKNWENALEAIGTAESLIKDVTPANCNFLYESRTRKFIELKRVLETDDEPLEIRVIKELNTKGNEIIPFLSPDGRFLYFTGEGRPDNYRGEDPYRVSVEADNRFGVPELVNGLTGENNESLVSISLDGKTAMVYVDGELHQSTFDGKIWNKPTPVQLPRTRFSWVGKATVNADASILIFEAKEKQEKQELYYSENIDLYVCIQLPNGSWGEPFALPNTINTSMRERSPYLHIDGKTLYFSSNGLYGLGGMDMFKTTRLDDTWRNWSPPVNMGRYINTPEDDWGMNFSVSADGKVAFFSKEVSGRRGELMCFGLPKNLRPKSMKIIEIPIKAPTSSTAINVTNRNGELIKRISTNPTGIVLLVVDAEEEHIIVVSGDENIVMPPIHVDVSVDSVSVIRILEVTEMININDIKGAFELPDVRFGQSESVLNPQARKALDKFKEITQGKKHILIIGHTDDVGPEEANQRLSEFRANTVKQYLVSIGYPERLIQTEGRGEMEPKVPNTSDFNRAINRRVEFHFLKH